MSLQNFNIDRDWTLFLDRDGVINRRIVGDYVKHWEQFEFLPGVVEAICKFSSIFGKIIVVSNQQGVGKGLMTENEVNEIHRKMIEEIVENGGRIDAVFFSPYLESAGSIIRKPGIGMALRARKQFPQINFRKSLIAGDSLSDMLFGKRVGMKTVFLSDDPAPAKKNHRLIDFCYSDLKALAESFHHFHN